MTKLLHEVLIGMPFSNHLVKIRKQRNLTQKTLAALIGLTKLQIYRYEKGVSQPTLEVLKKLALHLNVSLDELVFDKNERGPSDDFKLRFEAIERMEEKDKNTIKSVLDGMILKHQTKVAMGNIDT